ncbi:MAG: DUF4332 domain-containing protein [Candidatus Hodarchaeota archaeon]
MLVKVKKDTLEKAKLVIFERGYVIAGGSLITLFLVLDVIMILILILGWEAVIPMIWQTPIVPGIAFLSGLSLFLYITLPRFVKYITFDKEGGFILIFNLLTTKKIPTAQIDRLELEKKGSQPVAWLVHTSGKKTLLFRKSAFRGEKSEMDAVLAIEKHLRKVMTKNGLALSNYLSTANNFTNFRDKGLEDLGNGKIDEAIKAFQAATNQDPADKWSWRDLGVLLEGKGMVDAAVKAYEKVIGLTPRDKFTIKKLKALTSASNPILVKIHEKSFFYRHWAIIGTAIIIVGIFMSLITGFLLVSTLLLTPGFISGNASSSHELIAGMRVVLITSILFLLGNWMVFSAWNYPHPKLKNEAKDFMGMHILALTVIVGLAFIFVMFRSLASSIRTSDFSSFSKANLIQVITFAFIAILMPLYVVLMGFNESYSKTRKKINVKEMGLNFLSCAGSSIAFSGLLSLCFQVFSPSIASASIFVLLAPFSIYIFLKRNKSATLRLFIVIAVECGILLTLVATESFFIQGIIGISSSAFIVWYELKFGPSRPKKLIPDKEWAKLVKTGVKKITQLQKISKKDLKNLGVKTGITFEKLDTWQDIALLSKLPGINLQYAKLLKDIGIDSIKELARRNPLNLLKKINTYFEQHTDLGFECPSGSKVIKWIRNAKKV